MQTQLLDPTPAQAHEAPETATIKGALQAFFRTCPVMDQKILYADWLPEQPRGNTDASFAIYSVPCDVVTKQYTSGASLRQYLFILRSVNDYTSDDMTQLENSGMFERLSEWVEQQSRSRNFPKLPNGLQAIRISTYSTPYLESVSQKFSKYQLQCKLEYMKE